MNDNHESTTTVFVATIMMTLMLSAAVCLFPWKAIATDKLETGTLSIVFENDLFYNADRHYTNGVRISWLVGPNKTPDWVVQTARLFPLFPKEADVRTIYSLGQNMYTPRDITDENPPLDTRPYAGWLYGSVGLAAETGKQLDQIALSFGVVGPASLAKETQQIVHKISGANEPRGWHTQLKNEPGAVLIYQRSWRAAAAKTMAGIEGDVTPHAGGALGNVFTYINAGLTLRIGRNLPLDYGAPRIQPSLPGSSFFVPRKDFGWYLFAGAEGRAVARNIFLDGNTFRDSRSVDKKPFVGDLQFGIALTWSNVRLSYTHVLRTREFKAQDERDDFGALSLSIRL